MRDHLRFYLNGREQTVRGAAAFETLTDYLRGRLGLVGAKVVCAEGDCGACTVLVGRPDLSTLPPLAGEGQGGGLRYAPVDSCIQFLYQIDGAHVVTVEGLSTNGELHPIQRAMVDCHGSQCGYCTPGFVMALAGWAEGGCRDNRRLALTGNLCRCTGYLPILDAAVAIATEMPNPLCDTRELAAAVTALSTESLCVAAARHAVVAPTTLADAVAFKAARPGAVIVAGATELGVLHNKRGDDPLELLSLARIADLSRMDFYGDHVVIGANVTWAQIERDLVPVLPALEPIVRRFGSPQIRAVATLAGNVANGSPIADALPLLLVMDAELELVGSQGIRPRPINGFYTGYKQKDMAADELLARVTLPLPAADDRLRLYKVSRRNDLDIATFGAAIRIRETGGVIRRTAVAYSGVGPTVMRLPRTEAALTGKPFRESTFRQAGRIARSEVAPITDVRGGRDFRLQLAENILTKFYFEEAGAEVLA
jgi:xanthine dehydrogenase small subunit